MKGIWFNKEVTFNSLKEKRDVTIPARYLILLDRKFTTKKILAFKLNCRLYKLPISTAIKMGAHIV